MPSIDKRVVQVNFNNSQFERGVKQTIQSLSNLKKSMNFDTTMKSLEAFNKASNTLKFNSLTNNVEKISKSFTGLKVVGATALSELTKTAMNTGKKMAHAITDPLIEGGKRRAMNIEQAKFQFEGLGINVEKAMNSALKAVSGTAYGLDAAARVASQFGSSGMKAGNQMTKSLRAVAGVAAMTGSQYEDIGMIFAQVSGKGRLMGDELLQLSSRGINAAATLGKELGKSETEIREMVSKGQIDFKTFYTAMDNAFGKHAKDANKTFTGALSNMKAALSRIGADVATPAFDNLKDIFNSLTPVIDEFHEALTPTINSISKSMKRFKKDVTGSLKDFDTDPLKDLGKGLRNLYETIRVLKNLGGDVLIAFSDGLSEIIPEVNTLNFKNTTRSILDFAKALELSEEAQNNFNKIGKTVTNVVIGIENIFKSIGSVIKPAIEAVNEEINIFSNGFEKSIPTNVVDIIYKLSESFRKLTENMTISENGSKIISGSMKLITSSILTSIKILTTFGSIIGAVLSPTLKNLGDIILVVTTYTSNLISKIGESKSFNTFIKSAKELGGAFSNLIGNIDDYIGKIDTTEESSSSLANVLSTVKEVLNGFKDTIEGVVKGGLDKVSNVFSNLSTYLKNIKNPVEIAEDALSNFFILLDSVKNKVEVFKENIKKVGDVFKGIFNTIKVVLEPIKKVIDKLLDELNFGDVFDTGSALLMISLFNDLAKTLKKPSSLASQFITTMKQVTKSITDQFEEMQKKVKAEKIKQIAISVAVLAASVAVLSLLKPENVVSSVGAITVLLLEVVMVLKKLDEMELDSKNIAVAAAGIIALSAGISILAGALVKLKDFESLDSMIGPIVGLSTVILAITAAMAALIKVLDDTNDDTASKLVATSMAILITSMAIKSLSKSLKILGSMDREELIQGGIALAGVMSAIVIFTKALDGVNVDNVNKLVTSLALSFTLLYVAVKGFGSLDIKTLLQGMGSVALLMTGLTVSIKLMNATQITGVAASLLALAAALNMLIVPIAILGNMNIKTLIQGGASLAAMLLLLVTSMNAISGFSGTGSIALMAIAVALNLLVAPILALSAIPFKSVITSMAALGAAILGLSVVMTVLAPLAPSILTVSAAFAVFSGAMALVGIGIGVFSSSLIALAASAATTVAGLMYFISSIPMVATAMNGALKIIAKLAPSMADSLELIIKESIRVLGNSTVRLVEAVGNIINAVIKEILKIAEQNIPTIVGIAVLLVKSLINGIAENITDIIKSGVKIVKAFLKGITKTIPDIINVGITFIKELLKGMTKTVPDIAALGVQIVKSFLKSAETLIPDIVDTGMKIIEGILTGISDNIQNIIQAGTDIITNFLEGIGDSTVEITEAGKDMILYILNGISESQVDLVDKGAKIAIKFINGMTKAFNDNHDEMINAIDNLITTLFYTLAKDMGSAPGKFKKYAKAAMDGFKQGIKENNPVGDVLKPFTNMLNKVKEFLGINSPSTVFRDIGINIIEGLVNGVKSLANKPAEVLKEVAEKLPKPVRKALGIKSPSRVFAKIGSFVMDGLIKGIKDSRKKVKLTMNDIAKLTTDEFVNKASRSVKNGSEIIGIYAKRLESMGVSGSKFNKAIYNMTKSLNEFTEGLYRNTEAYKDNLDTKKQYDSLSKSLPKEEKKLLKQQEKLLKETTKLDKKKEYLEKKRKKGTLTNKEEKQLEKINKRIDDSTKAYEDNIKALEDNQIQQEQLAKAQFELIEKEEKDRKAAITEYKNDLKEVINSLLDFTQYASRVSIDWGNVLEIDTETETKGMAEWLRNNKSQWNAYLKWQTDIEKLTAMGYEEIWINQVREAGYQNRQLLDTLLKARNNQVEEANKQIQEKQKEDANDILRQYKEKEKEISNFVSNLEIMAMKGYSRAIIERYAKQGPEEAAEAVDALAKADINTINELNRSFENQSKLTATTVDEIFASIVSTGSLAGYKATNNFNNILTGTFSNAKDSGSKFANSFLDGFYNTFNKSKRAPDLIVNSVYNTVNNLLEKVLNNNPYLDLDDLIKASKKSLSEAAKEIQQTIKDNLKDYSKNSKLTIGWEIDIFADVNKVDISGNVGDLIGESINKTDTDSISNQVSNLIGEAIDSTSSKEIANYLSDLLGDAINNTDISNYVGDLLNNTFGSETEKVEIDLLAETKLVRRNYDFDKDIKNIINNQKLINEFDDLLIQIKSIGFSDEWVEYYRSLGVEGIEALRRAITADSSEVSEANEAMFKQVTASSIKAQKESNDNIRKNFENTIKNVALNNQNEKLFKEGLNKLKEMGYMEEFVQYFEEQGLSSFEELQGFLTASGDEVLYMNQQYSEKLKNQNTKITEDLNKEIRQTFLDSMKNIELNNQNEELFEKSLKDLRNKGYIQEYAQYFEEQGVSSLKELQSFLTASNEEVLHMNEEYLKKVRREGAKNSKESAKAIRESFNTILHNAELNNRNEELFEKALKDLKQMGYIDEYVDYFKEQGSSSLEELRAFLTATGEEVIFMNQKYIEKASKETAKNTAKATDDIRKNFEKAMKNSALNNQNEKLFKEGLKQLETMGYSKEYIKYFKEQGSGSLKELQGFLTANGDEVLYMNEQYAEKLRIEMEKVTEKAENDRKEALNTYLQNAKINQKSIEEYKESLKTLKDLGYNEEMMKYFQSLGVQNLETLKSFLTASSDQVVEANNLANEQMNLSADKLIEDANTRTQKMVKWSEDIKTLIKMGFNKEIISDIITQGVDGATDLMTSYLLMTPEEIQQINNNNAESLKISENMSKIIAENYEDIGKQAGSAFNKGLSTFKNDALHNLKGPIKESSTEIDKEVKKTNDSIKNTNETVVQQYENTGKEAGSAFVNGLSNSTNKTDSAKPIIEEFKKVSKPIKEVGKDLINKLPKKFINDIINEIKSDDKVLRNFLNRISSLTGDDTIRRLTNDIKKGKGDINSSAKDLINTLIKNIGSIGKRGISEIPKMFINELINGIKNGNSELISFINEASKLSGNNTIKGLIDSIKKGKGDLNKSAEDLINELINTINKKLGIHSPSKVFMQIGEYCISGMTNGIKNNRNMIKSSGKIIADDIVESTKTAFEIANKNIFDNLDTDPVIRPIIDIDKAMKDTQKLNNELSKTAATALNHEIVAGKEAREVNNTNNRNGEQVVNNYTFEQNNYSPKAISRIDIYRQTRSQFAKFKNEVGGVKA